MFPRILFPHEKIWFETFRAGHEAQNSNRLDEAVILLERALNIAIQQRLSSEQILHTYLAYGLALIDNGKMEDAERVYRRALRFSEKSGRQHKVIHMLLFAELGMVLLVKNEYVECRTLFEKAVEIHNKRKIKMDEEFVYIYSALVFCYVSLGDFEKAMVLGHKALESAKKALGADHERTQAIAFLVDIASEMIKENNPEKQIAVI